MNKFNYINYELIGTCPAPWSSQDEGELWLADDYFMTMQRFPLSWNDLVIDDEPETPFNLPIIYPYAMLVFHKIDRHYPRPDPIIVLTLEVSDLSSELRRRVQAEMERTTPEMDCPDNWSPIFFCMFQNHRHYNFGFYDGGLEIDAVRRSFFKKLNSILYFKSQPRRAGVIQDAFGHPATGLEATGY